MARTRLMPAIARMLIRFIFLSLACVLFTNTAHSVTQSTERVVYLARDLSDEELIVLGATLAGRGENNILLLDSPNATPYLKSFLSHCMPARIIAVGGKAEDHKTLDERLETRISTLPVKKKELSQNIL